MLKLSLSLRNYTRLTRAITDVSRISDGGCTNIKANRKNERSAEISERLVRKKKFASLLLRIVSLIVRVTMVNNVPGISALNHANIIVTPMGESWS